MIKDIDLELAQHHKIAIVGPSGSGKSTLLSLIAGLETPSSGSVRVLGTLLNHLNENQRAAFRLQNIGMVFQSFHLLSHLTTLENAALPLLLQGDDKAFAKAHTLLEQVGLSERQDHLPKDLSGGEAQRVAIARAIIHEPSIILADEPAGSLDTKNGGIVRKLLFRLVDIKRKTLVLVTHNLEWAADCDQVFTISDGHLEPQRTR